MFLIDSDRAIDWLKGRREAVELLQSLEGPQLLSVISYGEILDGIYGSAAPAHQQAAFDAFLDDVKVVGLSRSTMSQFARLRVGLRRNGVTVGDMDLLIAATALNRNLTLVTRNLRDFSRVPGLSIL